MRWSLRYQLLIPILVLLLGAIGISAWVAAHSAQQAVRQQIEAQLRQVARTLSEANFPFTPRVLEQIKDLSGADYLLVAKEGQLLSTLPRPPAQDPAPTAVTDWRELRLGPAVSVDGQTYLCARVWLRRALQDDDDMLAIFYPEARWQDALWQAVRPSLVLALLGSLGSVALALAIAHWLTRRIRSVEQHTRLIAAGDFRPLPVPAWNDELGDLARSINGMAAQLARLHEAVRTTERLRLLGQVSGGLAHQLRNGVAGARLAVQVHARECTSTLDQEALEVALRQLSLVEEKLQRFLHLGRSDRPCRRPRSLAELVDEAVALFRPQCRHSHIELRWQPPVHPITVLADPGQLGHLFVNILGNAVEAVGSGGWIEVCVRPLGAESLPGAALSQDQVLCSSYAIIEVSDSGPGPSADVAGRLFDEFVTSKPEGVGLGLAVARRIAEAHAGWIDWRREQGQTTFQILLPVLPGDQDHAGARIEEAPQEGAMVVRGV